MKLVEILQEAPLDIDQCAVVANWFYSPNSKLPKEVLNNLDIWKNVLALGFRFGPTYRKEDLRALVDRFNELFDGKSLKDQESWELLIRAYGILGRSDKVGSCIEQALINKDFNKESLYSSCVLAYAATGSHADVDRLLKELKDNNLLTQETLQKLVRTYGFLGDVNHSQQYWKMCREMYPQSDDKTMLLMAHKVALENMCTFLENTRGVQGLDLKPDHFEELDQLHTSWIELTKNVLDDRMDVTDCNIVLEYLAFANRIDPINFPMEKAEEVFESYMPSHDIKPNDATYRIMLVGYATSRQYIDPVHNIRLDKALGIVAKMQVAGIETVNHPTFHSLFRACLPHNEGRFDFDNFSPHSPLSYGTTDKHKFKLDPRLFEIEKIMLDAKLPHDRFSFKTLVTCLASSGQYRALRGRWRLFKMHGIRRDEGLFQHAFALASLSPEQSKHALAVLRTEMIREVNRDRLHWDTYVAMLNCCIMSQSPVEAKEIMLEMRNRATRMTKEHQHGDKLVDWPFSDSPDFYLPMLRTALSIEGLEQSAKTILKELEQKQISYNQGMWEVVLSGTARKGDIEGVQRLFNRYTMDRFEKKALVPIPVRENVPVIPFPSAPYNRVDMEFIDAYIASLLDSQDISLIFDVLRTLNTQTDEMGISTDLIKGIKRLALKEKSLDDLAWFNKEILPKVPQNIKATRVFVNHNMKK
ncbi:hypothetical protein K501DRAFT_234523 [Backusella circina FSU 941]|nr:hypothetical protein K501DRAFT_234523 [Backusella circina FSU 941]